MYTIIFYIIAAAIPIGGIFIAIGLFKGKIKQNTAAIIAHDDDIKKLVSKDELAAVITRGDERLVEAMRRYDERLEIINKRTEEDRTKGQWQWREFNTALTRHAERIGALETQQSNIMKSLDEMRTDIRDMGKDIKELLLNMRKTPV